MTLVSEIYQRFFRPEEEVGEDDYRQTCRELLDWMSCPYHAKFVKWLEDQIFKPIDVKAEHLDLLQAAVRANTFREIMNHLDKIKRNAMDTVEESRGTLHG